MESGFPNDGVFSLLEEASVAFDISAKTSGCLDSIREKKGKKEKHPAKLRQLRRLSLGSEQRDGGGLQVRIGRVYGKNGWGGGFPTMH